MEKKVFFVHLLVALEARAIVSFSVDGRIYDVCEAMHNLHCLI